MNNKGVLVLYTGGTIGSVPQDPNDPNSPRVTASWGNLKENVPLLKTLKFKVDAYSFDPPLDSSDMKPEYWVEMVEVIEDNYDNYEGFVVVHGTDTMSYTASALSFMLENLNKPVILTGSQIPIVGNLRSDGEQNLITSLLIANPAFSDIPIVPEVCIFFRDHLMRGNRTYKSSSSGYAGFSSPNYPPLGVVGENIVIDQARLRPITEKKLKTHKTLNTDVISLIVFPGIQNSGIWPGLLKIKTIQAYVLLTYGAGNTPSDPKFLEGIGQVSQDGRIILNVTQCTNGQVDLGLYGTSVGLLNRGVISGTDITQEAALCKLMVLLGEPDISIEEVRRRAQLSLAGEQSHNVYPIPLESQGRTLEAKTPSHSVTFQKDWETRKPQYVEKVLLYLHHGHLEHPQGENVKIEMAMQSDVSKAEPAIDTFTKQPSHETSTIVFNITKLVKPLLAVSESLTLSLKIETEPAQLTWKRMELTVFTQAN